MATYKHFMKDEASRFFSLILPLIGFYLLLTLESNNIPKCISPRSPSMLLPLRNPSSVKLSIPSTPHPPSKSLSRTLTQPLPSCSTSKQPAKTFLFVFMGHSGSSAILSELQGHSQTYIDEREPIDHYEYEHNTTLALQYTREYFKRGLAMGKTSGFKMRPKHIKKAPAAWTQLAKEFDTRIIWQYRENLVKQAVGEYSYKYLNDTSVLEGLRAEDEVKNRCERGVGCKFTIKDFGFFHRTLTDCLHSDMVIARGVNLLANGSECVYALPYEDYLYEREVTMQRLFRFLGLKFEKTMPLRFKATNDNLCNVVENWEQLCAEFYGCHVWRHMFEDERNKCGCRFSSGHVEYCDATYVP